MIRFGHVHTEPSRGCMLCQRNTMPIGCWVSPGHSRQCALRRPPGGRRSSPGSAYCRVATLRSFANFVKSMTASRNVNVTGPMLRARCREGGPIPRRLQRDGICNDHDTAGLSSGKINGTCRPWRAAGTYEANRLAITAARQDK